MASEQRVRRGESIAAAVKKAAPGARIVIEPGLYRESVRIDKPLELVGDGSGEAVELWPAEGSCLEVEADQTVLRGLRLHGRSRTPVISMHRAAFLEDCVLTGGSPVVAIGGSDIVLKRCLMAEGKTGLHLGPLSRNIEVDDCAIARNDGPGIVLEESTEVVTNCRIYDNRGPGVAVLSDIAYGPTIRGCDIYGNAGGGVRAEAEVRVEQCHIHHNGDKQAAVHVVRGSFSQIKHCEIDGFGRAGVYVENADVNIEDCDIHDGLRAGVVETGTGAVHIERCEIHGVRGVGLSLDGESTRPTMVDFCHIHHVDQAGVEIGSSASPSILGGKIHHNGGPGIVVLPGGGGELLGSKIYDNAVLGVDIQPGGDLFIRDDCRIDQTEGDR